MFIQYSPKTQLTSYTFHTVFILLLQIEMTRKILMMYYLMQFGRWQIYKVFVRG